MHVVEDVCNHRHGSRSICDSVLVVVAPIFEYSPKHMNAHCSFQEKGEIAFPSGRTSVKK